MSEDTPLYGIAGSESEVNEEKYRVYAMFLAKDVEDLTEGERQAALEVDLDSAERWYDEGFHKRKGAKKDEDRN